MTIGIILGSTREGRVGETIANWVNSIAQDRPGVDYELVDLKDYDLPFFTGTTPPMALNGEYSDPETARWAKKIGSFDGFVFVTPEYNQSAPAAMKNAYDSIGVEWQGKPVAFVGYSYGGGLSAVKSWLQITSTFKMPQVEQPVSINLGEEFKDGAFVPAETQQDSVNSVLSQLEDLVAKA